MPEKIVKGKKLLYYSTLFVVFLVFFFGGLYFARGILVPLAVSVLLAMVVMPLVLKIEKWTGQKWLGALTGSLTVFIFLSLMLSVVIFQISEISENWPELKQKAEQKIEKAEDWVIENTPMSASKLKVATKRFRQSTVEDVEMLLSKATATFTDLLIILIYIYLMIFYREKFKRFLEAIAPDELKNEPEDIINETVDVAQQYLAGKTAIVVLLIILYSIGLTIVGIKYALLIAIIAAFMSIIPYIGNIIGGGLALVLALFTKGTISSMIGVMIVFSVVQFVESYLLTPFVIQKNIQLNPFFTILAVILGGAIWGIPGMIIGIPYLAIVKLLFGNVKSLQPAAELLESEKKEESDEPSLIEKIKNKFT